MPSYYPGVAAGKTGTTENSADAWFCGFDPKLATAVWMGYPQAEIPMPGVQGATYCVPIWGRYYEMVFGSQAVPDFTQPAKLPTYTTWHGAHATGGPGRSGARRPRRRHRRRPRAFRQGPRRGPRSRPRRRRAARPASRRRPEVSCSSRREVVKAC